MLLQIKFPHEGSSWRTWLFWGLGGVTEVKPSNKDEQNLYFDNIEASEEEMCYVLIILLHLLILTVHNEAPQVLSDPVVSTRAH